MALNLALCFSDVHSQILQQPLRRAMEQRRLRCSQWQRPSHRPHHASPAGASGLSMMSEALGVSVHRQAFNNTDIQDIPLGRPACKSIAVRRSGRRS